MKRLFGFLLAGALLSGCQTQRSLYHWGNYEAVAYLSYSKPDKATLEMQLEKLQEDVAKAQASAAHPGLHAQLGYVYFQLGRVDDAIGQFGIEKTLFPESSVFMDRMIEKAKGGSAK
jgi:hypothetical protein